MTPDVYIDTPVGGWPGRGNSTLVLGAGVSCSRGVPLWGRLVEDLWSETLGVAGTTGGSFDHPFEGQARLELTHRWLCDTPDARTRLARELVAWWSAQNPPREVRLRGRIRCSADDVFRELLRRALYRHLIHNHETDTLGVIARVLQREAGRGAEGTRRRLLRVITFNADSLLEREVNGVDEGGRARTIALWPIAAANTPPMRHADAIPIYHVHGYLPLDRLAVAGSRRPRKKVWGEGLHDDGALVFTDAEYWSSAASPLSFANRVVANALHDSRCIFVGLSMTDVNLWRWLGIRAVEIHRGVRAEWEASGEPAEAERPDDEYLWMNISHEQSHEGHMWIRTGEGAAAERLSEFLATQRGVKTLKMDSWKTSDLEDAFDRLFPP
jgi:hypothetical protein